MSQPDLPEDLRQRLQHKKLIFSVNSGRCGSGYLARVLRWVPGIGSFHEPEPLFQSVMRQAQGDLSLARRFLVEQKLPTIAALSQPIYLETSHLFSKGFFEPLLELGLTPHIIFLTRPPRPGALSFYQLGSIPGRNHSGLRYLIGPEDPGVLALPGWQKLHDYQLCYWYCLEMERRIREYESMLLALRAPHMYITLAELTTPNGFARLIAELGLPPLSLRRRLGYLRDRSLRLNQKTDEKMGLPAPENISQLELEVQSLCFPRQPIPPSAAQPG